VGLVDGVGALLCLTRGITRRRLVEERRTVRAVPRASVTA